MDKIRILETKERILAEQNADGDRLRRELTQKRIFFVNVMASPGAGKTTLLVRTIQALTERGLRVGVMEADVDSDVDAKTIQEKTGARVIQLHTGGSCHMDADMTARGIEGFGLEDLDVLFLENVGNLVCPAEFDVGAHLKVMLLSVPEGDDKPLKYPLMFEVSDILLINKIDTAPVFDFDFDACEERARGKNPKIEVHRLSALTGDGFEAWAASLSDRIRAFRVDIGS
ncbi:MAG: hydrogenase nickel incorporation protein HypB [Lachnospiraceae bacterium]|nr:hydrogenase nickel incorporation protein HypB [Lachnospiraceae bacterium]